MKIKFGFGSKMRRIAFLTSLVGALLISLPFATAQSLFPTNTPPTGSGGSVTNTNTLPMGYSSGGAASCGNDGGGGATEAPDDAPPDDPSNDTPDPINTYTTDEYRKIDDLTVWGSVGEKPLTFSRYAHSRTTYGKAWFGQGHNWRHSYQWEMADAGTNGSGQAQVTINYPDGGSFTFTQVSSTQWTGVVGCADILSQSGNDFYLLRSNGWVYHFVYTAGGVGGIDYLMTDVTDNQGAVTTVAYDSHNRVSVITEPGGRTLTLKYALLNSSPGNFTTLGTVTTQPPSATWTQISIPGNTTSYRYLRYVSADDGYCNIGQIQFLDSSNNIITGTPFGSGPAAATNTGYAEAFDGNTNDYCSQVDSSGGYTGIDIGTNSTEVVAAVRFYPRVGYESSMIAPQPATQVNGTFQASNNTPLAVTVITEVDCSDGRTVTYNYSVDVDPTAGYTYQVLAAVTYDDGTQATYTYAQIQPSTVPLVSAFNDPRYASGPMARSQNAYYNDKSNIFGALYAQGSYDTGNVVTTTGIIGGDLHKPSATYGWGATESYYMVSGSLVGFPGYKLDCLGRKTTYTYDANGFLASATDPLSRTISYTNSQMGHPLQITLADGSTRVWTRDSEDKILTYQDELGRVTTYTRDAAHRVTQITYADSSYEAFTYNSFGEVLTHTLRNGGVETSTYDSTGLLLSKVDAVGQTSTFTYDSYGRLASITDPNSHTTSYQYNLRGKVTQITYADGTTHSYTYDQYGNKLTDTDENGNTSTYAYDQYQRLVSVTDPLSRKLQYVYRNNDYFSQPSEIILPSGKTTTYTYDAVWNKLSQTSAYGTGDAATTTWVYDAGNRPTRLTDPKGHTAVTTYDTRDRKLTFKDNLARISQWSYDAVGNVLTQTRPDGGVTTNTYDVMNHLLTTTDPKSETTTNSYDEAGRLESITDANSRTYGFGYDNFNRKTIATYPNGSYELWTYDNAGNLSHFTTRKGTTQSYTYDDRNRPLTTSWSDSTPGVTSTYDSAGRLLTQSNSNSALSYTYDDANQELSETQAVTGASSRTVSYTYDLDGNRSTLTYPSGTVVNYTYTNRNQMASLATGATTWASFTYDVNGNRTLESLGNTDRALYTYDNDNELVTLHNNNSGTTVLAGYTYTYNSVGDRLSCAETILSATTTQSYGYDAVDQVTSVNYPASRTQSFTYDSVGNRTQSTDSTASSPTNSYSVNNLNEYTSVGGNSLSYDSNGNLTIYNNYTYTYDSQNRLTEGQQSSNLETIAYDPKNRVVSRTFNGVTTYYVYDGWNLAEEYSSGTLQNRYIYGPRKDEIVARYSASSGTLYYHQDGLGSVVALSSSTGGTSGVLERYLYDAFGNATITNASGTVLMATAYGNRFLFTGREWIAELGVYDYRNRVYSTSLGRFLQTDPMRLAAGDVNIYRYCKNSPINLTDAMGLDCSSSNNDADDPDLADQDADNPSGSEFAAENSGGGDNSGSDSTSDVGSSDTAQGNQFSAQLDPSVASAAASAADDGFTSAATTAQNIASVGQTFSSTALDFTIAAASIGLAIATDGVSVALELGAEAAIGAAETEGAALTASDLTEAARAALGKGPSATPGLPLTSAQLAGLQANLDATLSNAASALENPGIPNAANIFNTGAQRVEDIFNIVKSGVGAAKN